MKKLILLLLISSGLYAQVPSDATQLENIQLTNATADDNATQVIVRDAATGVLRHVLKTSIKSPIAKVNVSGTVKTTTDVADPFVYNTIETDAKLGLKANLASPTFTGTVNGITKAMVGLGNVDNTSDLSKPISTATQTALDLKANLASPTFTGVPLAPTATAGTNTTQIATTAFVSTSNSGNLQTTSNQSFTGVKSAVNSGTSQINGISLTNNGTTTNSYSLQIDNTSSGVGLRSNNSSTGAGLQTVNQSTGVGIQTSNSSTGVGIQANNQSNGAGIQSNNSSTGFGIQSNNTSTGNGIVSNGGSASTGFVYVGQDNAVNTFTVTKQGAVTATSFARTGGVATDAQMANGTVKAIGNVDNTSDLNKAISTATQTALNGKLNVSPTTFDIRDDSPTSFPKMSITSVTERAKFQYNAASPNIFITTVGAIPLNFGTNDMIRLHVSSAGLIGINTTTPSEYLDVVGNGKFSGTVTATGGTALSNLAPRSQLLNNTLNKSANYTVVLGDFPNNNELILFVDTTAGNVTVTLPAFVTFLNYTILIKKVDASANSITVSGNANIDQATTLIISGLNGKAKITASSTKYETI